MQSLPRRTNGNEIVKSFRRIRDDANRVFNYSEWLGTARAVALRNVHHPGNQRGVAAARLAGYSILSYIGYDMLPEFWPEISRKFKLPFHAEPGPRGVDSNPASN
jgi:hypothetical protein